MTTVLHSMQRWLPLSEQFVYALVTRSRHRGVVLSRLAPENRETFPFAPIRSLRAFPPSWPRSALHRRAITLAVMAVAGRYRVGLVHHHHGYRLKDLEGAVGRLRVPLVVSLHGHDVTAYAPQYPGSVERLVVRADAIVVPSRFLAGRVVTLGAPDDRIRVIPSGVDVGWFSPTPLPPDTREAVFIGRFVEKKGLDVLIPAWARVRERVPGARLTLIGSGPLEPMARSAGEGVTVEITDPGRRAAQVRDGIRRARLVVTPSKTAADGDAETLLLVNLEAQASGRPLVTTRHGGIPEYVEDGVSAIVVPENDGEALADAMVRVLTDDGLAERLAAAGPAVARRFDVAACTAAVDDLYDELLAR